MKTPIERIMHAYDQEGIVYEQAGNSVLVLLTDGINIAVNKEENTATVIFIGVDPETISNIEVRTMEVPENHQVVMETPAEKTDRLAQELFGDPAAEESVREMSDEDVEFVLETARVIEKVPTIARQASAPPEMGCISSSDSWVNPAAPANLTDTTEFTAEDEGRDTLESLRQSIGESFDSVDERIAALRTDVTLLFDNEGLDYQRANRIETRLSALEVKLTGTVDTNITRVDKQIVVGAKVLLADMHAEAERREDRGEESSLIDFVEWFQEELEEKYPSENLAPYPPVLGTFYNLSPDDLINHIAAFKAERKDEQS